MSAAQEYKGVATEVRGLIDRLPAVLDAHAGQQARRPEHWCFTGDLKKVRLDLVQILAFLGDYDAKEELQFLAKGGESR